MQNGTSPKINDGLIVVRKVRAAMKTRLFPLVRRYRSFPISRDSIGEVVETTPTISVESDQELQAGGQPPIHLLLFVLIVIVPFLACLWYFVFIASDQYIAEARFAVRSLADQTKVDNVDSTLIGMDAATQDAYVVTSFIHSPELLARLGNSIDYTKIFSRTGIDFLSRLNQYSSMEKFQKYWRDQVSAYIDGPSGIVTLKVRTFRPQDSKILADAILAESERLINELNQRAQKDMVASVRGEVERAGKAYADALAALNRFQLESGLLSPEVQAKETGKLLTGLLGQKLQLETRLFVLKQSAAQDSPAYEQLLRAQSSVDSQVDRLRSELTGPENASIARAILAYSKLDTDRLVAEKLYEASRSNYDAALAASLRKALYLMVFVHPSLPEESLYPKRLTMPMIIALGLLTLWGTLMLIWASVEDHRL